ncbi:hypothetical protein [Verrucosispora sioxanthis]|uniref:hypothetical protein n=1 Tax=Verrucosispora sioxanthis TaxID=2499994 RepID=UPI001C111A1B|nr:hypothetical protein [Verrucosispora sioxanthis]
MRGGRVDGTAPPHGAFAPALRRTAALVVACLLLVMGCRAGTPGPDEVPPLQPDWRELTLPAPPGAPGRLMLRDVTACGGRWYIVGAVGGPGDATRPAAWTSADGVSWESVRIVADSYYGRQNILYSVACTDGRFAAVGAKSGGAHANPRVSSWVRRADGALAEVRAGFELYGGPQAVNVARMVAGPSGFMIVGNRVSGAAVWLSEAAGEFEILEGVPGLATDEHGVTWLFDATPVDGGWLAVGGIIGPGRIDRDPLAWRSSDGRSWQRVPVPGTDEYDELQRVVRVDGEPVAVGLRGRAFGGRAVRRARRAGVVDLRRAGGDGGHRRRASCPVEFGGPRCLVAAGGAAEGGAGRTGQLGVGVRGAGPVAAGTGRRGGRCGLRAVGVDRLSVGRRCYGGGRIGACVRNGLASVARGSSGTV